MLKYKYSLNTSYNTKQIFLDDVYISPDLTFISGTTPATNSLQSESGVIVRSPYFPKDMTTEVKSRDIVKRNGYIMVPVTLQVQSATIRVGDDLQSIQVMYYVEHNGNTYYALTGTKVFTINSVEYTATDISTLEIMDKVYVEDNKVVVNNITYNVLINNNSQVSITDSIGQPYIFGDLWDVSNVTSASTFVEKLNFGDNFEESIKCNSINYYGHAPYIIYEGEKKYIEYIYNDSGDTIGYGITKDDSWVVDGVEYSSYTEAVSAAEMAGLTPLAVVKEPIYYVPNEEIDTGVDGEFNIYNKLNYIDENGNAYMDISGTTYIMYFEPSEIRDSGIICIETEVNNIPILLGDRIIIQSMENSAEVVVKYDEGGSGYTYFNGRRFDVIPNLCDSVNLGGNDFMLTVESANTESGITIASTEMYDGSKMYFEVSGDGETKIARKVEYVEDEWQYVYTVQYSGGGVVYAPSSAITVDEHDGVQIDQYRAIVRHKEVVTGVNYADEEDDDSEVDASYDYIITNTPLEYRLVVIDTVGNNKLLCVPEVNPYLYDDYAGGDVKYEVLDSIVGNDFIIKKRSNIFGNSDLYFDTWLKPAYDEMYYSGSGTSAYEVSNILTDLNFFERSSYFTLPITLSNDVSDKIEYQDLVISNYYPGEEDIAINKLVDMEKDMYTPFFVDSNGGSVNMVNRIDFNLHFRTRDLDTWKILEDEGVYNGSGDTTNPTTMNLGANYQYCNYFITDYYPYYNYARSGGTTNQNDSTYTFGPFSGDNFYQLTKNSDLLGFLWFTTDDVKLKKDKLSKSFLRLTFFDSKNPEKQNMLGTSTLYFDCDRYFDVLDRQYEKTDKSGTKYQYEFAAQSRQPNRTGNDSYNNQDKITINQTAGPGVMTECFKIPSGQTSGETSLYNLMVGESNLKLDSRITVEDRYHGSNSSEGFYAYILKAFANKTKKQTIYMKAEFFHAGVGVKIPMVIPTKYSQEVSAYTAISGEEWNEDVYKDFIGGYDLDSVFDRLYVPITIEYSRSERRFIYSIGEENNYLNAIADNYSMLNRTWSFNLFELKIKP